jgi:hypothetical protein
MRQLKAPGSIGKRRPPIGVARIRPSEALADHRTRLAFVGWTHPVSGFSQIGRKVEPAARARRAPQAWLGGGPELDQRAIELHRVESVLDDIGDGTEPDVLPPGRHPAYDGLAERRASRQVGAQVRCREPGDQLGWGPEGTACSCAAAVITA